MSQSWAIEGRKAVEQRRDLALGEYKKHPSKANGKALIHADHMVTRWRLRVVDQFLDDQQTAARNHDDRWRSQLPTELLTHAALSSTEIFRLIRAYVHDAQDTAELRMSSCLEQWSEGYVNRSSSDA